jgi:mannan endo-1,4-beta-mannosidase
MPSGSPVTGRSYVDQVFAQAKSSNFTVIRLFAAGVTAPYASMDGQGRPVEDMLVGLDYLLDSARTHGIKLILSFVSNWTPEGGVNSFAGNLGYEHNAFFYEEPVKQAYRTWVESILTRNNTFSGLPYVEDPTIMAWNLINEPICDECEAYTLQNWIQEMSQFVKSIDSNHLLTVGEEGYSSLTEEGVELNPGSGWAEKFGQDFYQDHAFDEIDFATTHVWVDNWKEEDGPELGVDFFRNWIEGHVNMSDRLGKPLVLEEFGKKGRDVRDQFYVAAYEAVLNSARRNRSLVGALYWQFYIDGQRADWFPEDPERGPWGVVASDTPHILAEQFAAELQQT